MIHMSFVIDLHIVFVLMALFGQLVSQLLGNFAYQWGGGASPFKRNDPLGSVKDSVGLKICP